MLRMQKALFFDIDGTLVSFKTHRIPDSAVEALSKAKELGHKLFIATGRPRCIINNLGQIEHLIDGYVTTNGAYCYAGNEVIRQLQFNSHDTETILQDAKKKRYPTIIVNDDRLRVIHNNSLVQKIFVEQLNIRNLDYTAPLEEVLHKPILQITSFIGRIRERRLSRLLSKTTIGRWHPSFIDFTPEGADKGSGILAMAEYFGISRDNTIAFGDGGNDIPMLRAAGIGVAMGNAAEPTRAAASYITTHIDEDGIKNAFTRLGITD